MIGIEKRSGLRRAGGCGVRIKCTVDNVEDREVMNASLRQNGRKRKAQIDTRKVKKNNTLRTDPPTHKTA